VQLLNKISRPGAARHDLAVLRSATTAFFAIDGFIFASWAVRIPAVKEQTAASPAALGLALLGASGGAVATMSISGALCRRFGSRPMTVAGGAALSVALLLPPLARSAPALGLALVVFGVGYGCLNVAMNSMAVDLVAALRRPVMPSFHAAWSFGGLAGASVGGLLAPHLSALRHLALVAAAGLAVTAVCGRALLAHPLPVAAPGHPEDDAGPRVRAASRRHVWRVVLLFGLIAMCSAYGEGAIGDWGALHLRQDLGAGPGLAAAGYAAFALAEACGRLAGSALFDRLGQTRVLALGGVTACAGMLAAALAPAVPVALAGFALTGLGVANMFPAAMTRAGLLAGPHGVALASTLGYTGFLLGPPAIGFLAASVGLGAGLTTVSVLALVAAALAIAAGLPADPGPDHAGHRGRAAHWPEPVGGGTQRVPLVVGEVDLGGGDVALQLRHAGRAGDRGDRGAADHPRERDLGGGGVVRVGDLAQHGEQPRGSFQVDRQEQGAERPEPVSRPVARVVPAGQEPLGQRAVGDHHAAGLFGVRHQVGAWTGRDQVVANLVAEHAAAERLLRRLPAVERVVADADLADQADALQRPHPRHDHRVGHQRVRLMHLVQVEPADAEPVRAGDRPLLHHRRQRRDRQDLRREEHLVAVPADGLAENPLAAA
jgi:MFS family permease